MTPLADPPSLASAPLPRVLASLRRAVSEQPVLDAMPRELRVAVVRRIAQQEAARIGGSGWLLLPVALLLFRVDLSRMAAGTFDT